MDKVLFDTDIVLDLLLDREPFSEFAAKIAYALGIKTLSSFALFVLVAMLVVISLRYQISLIAAEKQIKNLSFEKGKLAFLK